MSYVLKYNDERGMSREEINSRFSLLTLAGSATTATLLSGCTFYVLKNPAVYVKLRKIYSPLSKTILKSASTQ